MHPVDYSSLQYLRGRMIFHRRLGKHLKTPDKLVCISVGSLPPFIKYRLGKESRYVDKAN